MKKLEGGEEPEEEAKGAEEAKDSREQAKDPEEQAKDEEEGQGYQIEIFHYEEKFNYVKKKGLF